MKVEVGLEVDVKWLLLLRLVFGGWAALGFNKDLRTLLCVFGFAPDLDFGIFSSNFSFEKVFEILFFSFDYAFV